MDPRPIGYLGLMLIGLILLSAAHAEPLAMVRHQGITVILTDEPCTLDAVQNLPFRAQWNEAGKSFDGCWGQFAGAVGLYFSDKTVAVIPLSDLRPAVGA